MANYTSLPDALSAKEGTAYITINGQNRELFEVQSISANIEKTVVEKNMLGSRVKQHKIIGLNISGAMTLALMAGDHLDATIDYLKTGVYPQITLRLKNLDRASTVGGREVLLSNVITTTDLLAMLDTESDDIVTYDTECTADGIEILNDFVRPANYR